MFIPFVYLLTRFPIKEVRNKTLEERELFYITWSWCRGADSILRGMLASNIPNFEVRYLPHQFQ
jgi:peroxidase